MGMLGIFSSVYFIFLIGVLGLGIYTTILFITALKIYIKKNS